MAGEILRYTFLLLFIVVISWIFFTSHSVEQQPLRLRNHNTGVRKNRKHIQPKISTQIVGKNYNTTKIKRSHHWRRDFFVTSHSAKQQQLHCCDLLILVVVVSHYLWLNLKLDMFSVFFSLQCCDLSVAAVAAQ